jgi:GYF domain 2
MASQEAIWHVLIDGKEQGPLTKAQVLECLTHGMLAGEDRIWRPGFPDWKSVSEIGDFWRPPKRPVTGVSAQLRTLVQSAPEQVAEPVRIDGRPTDKKWSLWKSANRGLLVSALVLLAQIGNGRGFELANYAHTASAATVGNLVGQIFGAPLLFVSIAVVRNLLNRRLPKSSASTARGALIFVALLVCIVGALWVYGEIFFSSNDTISGEARKTFIANAHHACVQKQRSLGQNVTEAQIDKYCICGSEKIADSTTYKQLGTEPDASAHADLKQKIEAAGRACR